MSDILQEIVSRKRQEIAAAKAARSIELLEEQLSLAPAPRGFTAALRQGTGVRIIAEVKKASPSAGVLRADFDPVEIARIYERHGATCLSVLTDEHFFQGKLEYLSAVREAVGLPILRKDFILDRYQIVEARVAGADAVLLIAECLDDCRLRDLYFYAAELDLDVLIEIYEPDNLDRVLKLEPELLGINNRNLRTFVTDLDHSLRMRDRVPASTMLVSESGIHNRDDVRRLEAAGIEAILVGETLMRAPDMGQALQALLGR